MSNFAEVTIKFHNPRELMNTVAAFTVNMTALEKIEAGELEVPIRTEKAKTKTVTAADVLDKEEKKAKAPAKEGKPEKEEAPAAEAEEEEEEEELPFKDTKPAEKQIGHDDVKAILGEKVKSGKKAEAAEIFKSYNVKKLSEFEETYPEPEKLAELYQKLEEL